MRHSVCSQGQLPSGCGHRSEPRTEAFTVGLTTDWSRRRARDTALADQAGARAAAAARSELPAGAFAAEVHDVRLTSHSEAIWTAILSSFTTASVNSAIPRSISSCATTQQVALGLRRSSPALDRVSFAFVQLSSLWGRQSFLSKPANATLGPMPSSGY